MLGVLLFPVRNSSWNSFSSFSDDVLVLGLAVVMERRQKFLNRIPKKSNVKIFFFLFFLRILKLTPAA
jgi:hypothetical protein